MYYGQKLLVIQLHNFGLFRTCRTTSFCTVAVISKSIVMSVSVCLCVCLPAIISQDLHVRSSPIFVRVTYGCGSDLIWRRSDMLRISGFVDDVIFAHQLILLDVAVRLRQ